MVIKVVLMLRLIEVADIHPNPVLAVWHIKYNFDVLERDYLPEEKDLRREEHQER